MFIHVAIHPPPSPLSPPHPHAGTSKALESEAWGAGGGSKADCGTLGGCYSFSEHSSTLSDNSNRTHLNQPDENCPSPKGEILQNVTVYGSEAVYEIHLWSFAALVRRILSSNSLLSFHKLPPAVAVLQDRCVFGIFVTSALTCVWVHLFGRRL